ncbi:MAG: cation transporter [Actinobacteria bacterium]|nr:cation transporter [Actinomycetota bacterium]
MTRTYSVPGVSCGHCQAAVEGEVGKLAGISSVRVDLDTKTVTIEGDAPEDEVIAAIDEAGYDVADAQGDGDAKGLPVVS